MLCVLICRAIYSVDVALAAVLHYIYETLGGVLKRTGFLKKTLKKVLTFAVACGIIIKHSGEGHTKVRHRARELIGFEE